MGCVAISRLTTGWLELEILGARRRKVTTRGQGNPVGFSYTTWYLNVFSGRLLQNNVGLAAQPIEFTIRSSDP
eukprot:6723429-Pyramimonas_sp.AAC.1